MMKKNLLIQSWWLVTLFFSQLKQKYDWAELGPQTDCKSSISRISALSEPTLFPVNLKQTNI